MRFNILEKIKAEDNLAILFNAYMKKLNMMDLVCTPTHMSMRQYHEAIEHLGGEGEPDENYEQADQLFNYRMPRHFQLLILSNSLNELHSNITGAIEQINKLFNLYDADLKRFAIEERLRIIDEFGSEDESDWAEDGLDAEGKKKWKVTFKEDEKTLKEYSLHTELNQFFPTDEIRGELIGASDAEHFEVFTEHVENATSFDVFKAISAFTGHDIPVYRKAENGEMVPQSLGERVENEINEDLRNQGIAAYFRLVFAACKQAAALQAFAHSPKCYLELLTLLTAIRDMKLGEAPATQAAA